MRRSVLPLSLLLVLSFLAPASLLAAPIAAPLDRTLALAGPDQFVRAIVFLADRVDAPAIAAGKATFAQRHQAVVRALMDRARATQGPILADLNGYRKEGLVRSFRALWIDNAIAVEAVPEVLYDLSDRRDVARIEIDPAIEGIAPVEVKPAPQFATGTENGLVVIRAPELWALGITGAGVLVATIDTGVDGNHVALKDRWRGLDVGVSPSAAWFDPVTNTTFPFDSAQHGTHTMGTIAGKSGTDVIGVAYDAKWIAAGVIDRVSISRTYSDALLAFQWAADPDGNPATSNDVPAVVSNSWGLTTSMGYPACDSYLWTAIDNVEAAGAAVVFAAGNEGPNPDTIRVPADRIASNTNTFSVGAIDQTGTAIAYFSSLGPSDCDNATIKPEVVAVGVDVRSSVPGNAYATMSGTSMATPHVAGAIALLRQAHPGATPAQLKEALYFSAVDLGAAGEDNTYGHGRIDLVMANDYLGGIGQMATISGTVTAASGGAPVVGASVALQGTSYQATTDSGGGYSIVAPGNVTYTIVASAFGYTASSLSAFCPGNATTDADFSLVAAPTGTIAGTVTDDGGNRLAGAAIAVTNHSMPGTTSDGSGNYSLAVPGGYIYDLQATLSGYQTAYANSLSVAPGTTVTFDFLLTKQSGGGCAAEAIGKGTAAAGTLDAYRALRDGLLSRDKLGQELAFAYYRHGPELARIAARNPRLAADAIAMMLKYAPRARAAADLNRLADLRLTPREAREVQDLIARYAAQARPELRTELERLSGLVATWSSRAVPVGRAR